MDRFANINQLISSKVTKYFYRKFIFKVPESRKTKTGIKDIFCKTKRFFGEFIDWIKQTAIEKYNCKDFLRKSKVY